MTSDLVIDFFATMKTRRLTLGLRVGCLSVFLRKKSFLEKLFPVFRYYNLNNIVGQAPSPLFDPGAATVIT